jgi:hypothetical protein
MTMRFRAAGSFLVVAAAALYCTRLSFAPIYLIHDEVNYSLQAISIARTAHDLNGRFMPLYFSEPEFPAGRDPMMIYATALILTFLPISEAAVRLASALVGVLDVALILVLARLLFASEVVAFCAGLLLALSPGHFIHSRMAVSVLFPLPFVLAWLIYLRHYQDRADAGSLKKAGSSLVVGMYAYLASWILMPMYAVMTWFVVRPVDNTALRRAFKTAIVLLLPLVLWQATHFERIGEIQGAYRIPALSTIEGLRFRLGDWFSFFNPDALFVSGDTSVTNSTRQAGVFPLALLVLIPIGIARLWRGSRFERLILAGLVTSPIALVLTGTINLHRYRALVVLPFGVLVAVYGVERLWASRTGFARAIAILLVAGVPLQFGGFYLNYVGDYRTASSVWFGRDLKGAMQTVLDRRAPSDRVFLSDRIPYGAVYWRFYTQMLEKDDGNLPATADDAFDPVRAPRGAWLIASAADDRWPVIDQAGWVREQTISEPNGDLSFLIYRKSN